MPIISYFLVAGSILFGLLCAVDAALPAREPLRLSSDFHGLAQAAQAPQAMTDIPILSRTSAPEPDMSSELVLAAQPPGQPIAQPARTVALAPPTGVVSASTSAAKSETAHKSNTYRKRVVQQRHDYRQAYAWQYDNRARYPGERRFGRF